MEDVREQTGPPSGRTVVMSMLSSLRGALASGDWGPFLQHFDPRVEFTEPVDGDFAGSNVGIDRLERFYRKQAQDGHLVVHEPDRIAEDGDKVTVRYVESIDRPNGRRSLNVSTVYTVREGRITAYVEEH